MSTTSREALIAQLKAEYFASIEQQTPDEIKARPLIDLSNEGEFTFTLTRELVEQLKLDDWLAGYRREAQHSTGGIRGPQNVLYPWDTRFPINQLGITLATIAKVLVLQERNPGKQLNKIAAGEVRYNTDQYIELISRLTAALKVTVHQPKGIHLTTIWMTSFLIFMLDYDGGEYVSSSHAISSKTATKDLEDQGSQFLPEMSLAFVDKIAQILHEAKTNPAGYTFKFSAKNDSMLVKDFDGFKLYAEHLRSCVATAPNLDLIMQAASAGMRIMFDTVGGCMYQNLVPLFKEVNLPEVFDWHNSPEDPFFHGVGKTRRLNPRTGQEEFFDLSCDASLPEVVRTMGYDQSLKDRPVGYTLFITDPDGDRLVIGQVEPAARVPFLQEIGIDYMELGEGRVLSIYHPGYTFLLIMDFHMRRLKAAGLWEKHPHFMVTTTPSPRAWDEWAKRNGIAVVATPVGIKEIAAIMKKAEKQMFGRPTEPVYVQDIWGRKVELGVEPRLVFGGEESGGMIIGPEEIITTRGGRKALAMREKSVGEASVIATALAAHLHLEKRLLSEHLEAIFQEYGIRYRSYLRVDITYYNESEPDPIRMREAKAAGEVKRDLIDTFYLGLALALRDNLVTLEQVKQVLGEVLPELDFSKLNNIAFVGDASYLDFEGMFVEVRKSGTDAKLRGYANGESRAECQRYLDALARYSGEQTPLYRKLVPVAYQGQALYQIQERLYREYLAQGL